MSEPWLVPAVLLPSAWRRRFLAGAAVVCAIVALALAGHAAAAEEPAGASMLAGVLVAAFASLAALGAASVRASTYPSALWPADTAGRVLRIDARGRIHLEAAPGLQRTTAVDIPSSTPDDDRTAATASCIGPLFVVLRATGGRAAMVWCDSLPRVGFRRLVVAARWGAGSGATNSRL